MADTFFTIASAAFWLISTKNLGTDACFERIGHYALGHFGLGHFDLVRMPHLALSSDPIARVAETLELQALVWSMVSPYRAAIS